MPKFNEILKLLRQEKQLSQQDFANKIGISKSSVNMYERGEREPGIETLEAIADYFNVDMDYLLGKSKHRNKLAWLNEVDDTFLQEQLTKETFADLGLSNISRKKIPMLGEIACGEPIFANEERESYTEVGTEIDADFCLKAKGDSMINARILDGDIVFIKKQPIVNNGEIGAVIIGDEATLKRVYYYPESKKLILNPENPKYEPLVYVGAELEQIRILGKAIAFQSDVR